MPGWWPYRKLLPLVMTAVQLVLLSLSLAQMFHLPTNPTELHRMYPPTAPHMEDGGGTVTFSPGPPEVKTTPIFQVALTLSFPAMLCGMLVGIPLILVGMQGSETIWIAMSAPFSFWMWSRIGNWIDEQRGFSRGMLPVRSKWNFLRKALLRIVGFGFLLLFVLSVVIDHHHRTLAEALLIWTIIAWSGLYLLLSFWGESRETRLARAQATTQTMDAS